MTDATRPAMSVPEWRRRMNSAEAIREQWSKREVTIDDEKQAQDFLVRTDPTRYVGARHHTVPRFILERWANADHQVRVFHRIENVHKIENISNLAIKDFYTFIDLAEAKNSTFESLLGEIEGRAKPYIDDFLNPFRSAASIEEGAVASLGQFAAFQSIRTNRSRRELELHGEWYAKTMVAGRITDEELRKYTIVPHQNEALRVLSQAAIDLMPFFVQRPLAVVYLREPLLYICDEPVILNAPAGDFHTEDCYLTDAEVEARLRRRLRQIPKRKRASADVGGRIVHFSSTRPTGHGIADEIVLPISPSAALLWGALTAIPQAGSIERVLLSREESIRFSALANEAMSNQALDWIASRDSDREFETKSFPPTGPLMRVCDGTNAASIAVNTAPTRFRPHRLGRP